MRRRRTICGQYCLRNQGNDYLSTQNAELERTSNSFDFGGQGRCLVCHQHAVGTGSHPRWPLLHVDHRSIDFDKGFPVLDSGGAPIQLTPGCGRTERPVRMDVSFRMVRTIGTDRAVHPPIRARVSCAMRIVRDLFQAPQPWLDQGDVGIVQAMSSIQYQRHFTNDAADPGQPRIRGHSSMMKSTEDNFSQAIRTLGGGQ